MNEKGKEKLQWIEVKKKKRLKNNRKLAKRWLELKKKTEKILKNRVKTEKEQKISKTIIGTRGKKKRRAEETVVKSVF